MKARVAVDLASADGPTRLDAAFALEPGTLAALVGPSGSGKTTLLRCLAGLHRPAAGRVEVGGRVWFDSAAGIDVSPQERGAGFVFQEQSLFPNMTVEQNLRFALEPATDPAPVEEVLAVAGLSGLRGRLPARLSGGQKQRVALARALVRRPALLLLDEPFSALDPAARARMQEELETFHRRYNTTTILVTHDAAEVRRLCRVVFELVEGGVRTTAGGT